ncbi:hypothetical protein HK439_24575 [Labrenzia aggregata]|uniref:Inner membrane protein n=1 Tax=Roseibium aggregatum TaxID=187304 RepID=A0A926P6I2_9HYPH|nr:hypothetical protein [Roseibium aggregatum]
MFGGIVVLSGAYGLHVAGVLNIQGKLDPATSRMLDQAERKIGDLESKLADLSKKAGGNEARALVTGLSDRMTALEKSVGEMAKTAGSDLAPELAQLKSGLAALEAKVDSLPASTGGGAGTAGTDKAIKGIDDRLAALEKSVSASQKLSGTVSGVETSVGDLKTALSDIETRLQNVEATAKAAQTAVSTSDVSLKTLADSQARASETLATLSADIETVSKTGKAGLEDLRSELDGLSKRLAAVEATMGDATAREIAARALSVSALKSAVDSGRPFTTELAAVKAGLPKDTDLAVLEAHAKTGVAPASVLIAEFPAVARKMYAAFSAPDRSGDLLDSFLAGAKSIVAVRGPGDENGTGPEAVLRRMENAVSRGDLAAGLEAYKELPEVAQKAGADWAERAEARVTVDRMTEAASKEVLSMLAGKDS